MLKQLQINYASVKNTVQEQPLDYVATLILAASSNETKHVFS